MRTILLKIDAGALNCGACQFLSHFQTGLAGEGHPRCELFEVNGDCRATDMKRTKDCLKAERKAKEPT